MIQKQGTQILYIKKSNHHDERKEDTINADSRTTPKLCRRDGVGYTI